MPGPHGQSSDDKGDGLPVGIVDYNFWCFGGRPRFLYVSKGLEDHATERISFLTMDWELAPFGRPDYRSFDELPPKPGCLDEMVEISRSLARDIPFVRVDLYEADGGPLFSEMKFSPNGGFVDFEPAGWDEEMGDWIDLPLA